MKKKILGLTTLLLFILFSLTGCNKYENESLSGSRLIVMKLTASSPGGSLSSVAYSDVLTSSDTVEEDFAAVTVAAELLTPDPLPEAIVTDYHSVVVKRIKVEYSRADGLSQQGRDVPYSFMQNVHQLIEIGKFGSIDFVLVQHTAKLESPLYELRFSPEVLRMEARITIYSQDMGGKWLEPVYGSLSVWFGNFD
ncbi:MAG: hypothetical protein KAW12_05210 [Candidatus Aminicenantes bacterium]|nr:hypothetical protein [Candidatus Aminicenantes bacterium]